MYLKDGYFAVKGPHPADDIGQGYLTFTVPAGDMDDLPEEILEAARDNPEILDQFRLDETFASTVAAETDAASFEIFRNSEMAFDGLSDCGYMGYGLDIAFSQSRQLALWRTRVLDCPRSSDGMHAVRPTKPWSSGTRIGQSR